MMATPPNVAPSIEQLRAQIGAFNEATLTITAELTLDRVLQRIVHLARELVHARYAALGIPDGHGGLEQFLTSGLDEEQVAQVEHPPRGIGLLGVLMRSTRPIRVARISEDPRSAGFCKGHPIMTSFLGVPIISKGVLLGTLYLTDKIGAAEFSEDDEQLIVMLAAHAAIAIENARLYQQVQRLAVLEERERIGMDLHDGIIQSIYAVGLMLEYSNLLLEEDPTGAKTKLSQAITSLNEVIRDIRNYILANTLIQADLRVEAESDLGLTQGQAAGLFHIAQEALANVAKHSRARLVDVTLARDGSRVTMSIRDNGRGFDRANVRAYEGHGLRNMEARARLLGGKFAVHSEPGQGTTVTVTVPIEMIGERGV